MPGRGPDERLPVEFLRDGARVERPRPVPVPVRLHEVDLAALRQEVPGRDHRRRAPPLHADLDDPVRVPDRLHHADPLLDGVGHRLLAVGVLPRLDGVGQHGAVPVLRARDEDRVDVLLVEELPVVSIRLGLLSRELEALVEVRFVDVADGCELHALRLVGPHDAAPAAARGDDPHHDPLARAEDLRRGEDRGGEQGADARRRRLPEERTPSDFPGDRHDSPRASRGRAAPGGPAAPVASGIETSRFRMRGPPGGCKARAGEVRSESPAPRGTLRVTGPGGPRVEPEPPSPPE
jgi:hypothetical protein